VKDKEGKTALDYAKESSWKLGINILEQAERLAKKNGAKAEEEVAVVAEEAQEETGVSKIKKRKTALG